MMLFFSNISFLYHTPTFSAIYYANSNNKLCVPVMKIDPF